MPIDPEIKKQRKLEAARKRRSTSRQHQKDYRKEQMEQGRKAVTIWVDPEYYNILQIAKEKYGEPNIRETTYFCLKAGIEHLIPEAFNDKNE